MRRRSRHILKSAPRAAPQRGGSAFSAPRSDLGLDELLPTYEFAERHTRRVHATPAAALAAAKAATPADMPFVRSLFALRSGPALLTRGRGLPRAKDRPLAEQMIEFGFVPLVERENEIVLGYVGQPWRLAGGSMPRLSADEWHAFAEPGYAKAVMNFRASEGVLETCTRVHLTDAASRRGAGWPFSMRRRSISSEASSREPGNPSPNALAQHFATWSETVADAT